MRNIISSVSGEPIYEQIKTQIRSAVLGGELKAGLIRATSQPICPRRKLRMPCARSSTMQM